MVKINAAILKKIVLIYVKMLQKFYM